MTEETLFAEALDAPDRAAFLDSHCGRDAELRRRVESLLAAHDQAGGFLRTDPDATRPHEPTAADADVLPLLAPPARPGSLGRLGHYDILAVLGKGGFGTVLKSFDERLHRVVAVKVLAPAFAASGPARARFLREGRTAAAVRDPHVVSIHAVSGDDDPVPYLVMEYIGGQTLQQKLDKAGPLSPAEVLRIGAQIARGLAAAHATGLIHRDVKPANILLENGVERVKLTDFGLARAADDASLSQSGVVAGTPMYMSPEQARGEPMDARGDLFSLGSVLYAMCAGRPPFRAESTLAVLKRVAENDPRPLREVNPQVPAWLADVVAKLHAKDPAGRFPSATEVADLLTEYQRQLEQNGTVVPDPAVRPRRRCAGWRSPARMVAVGVWLAAGLFWAAYFAAQYVSDRPADPQPLDPAVWGTFVNPAGDGLALQLDDDIGTIGMSGRVTHELYPNNNLFAPRLLRPVDGDFRFEASVLRFDPAAAGTGHQPGNTWRAAGLVVWQDDQHFFRFERACHTEQRDGDPYLQLEAFPDPAADKREYLPAPGVETYLQVERRGETFTLRVSDDGQTWRDWHTVRLPLGRTLKVGLVACNTSTELFVAGFRPPALTALGDPVVPARQKAAGGPVPTSDGFTPLFNGKDRSGWVRSPRPDLGEWTVTDGVLEGRTRQRDYLFTERGDYRDFHLRVEAQVSPGGDGGLMFRCERGLGSKFGTARGYETEISTLPDAPHGTLRLGPEGPDNTVLAKVIADRAGKWFTQEVIVRGNHIIVKVDGETVLDHTTAKEHYACGHIGLQVWGEGTVVQFRKVEVRELPEGSAGAKPAAAPPPAVAPFDEARAKAHQQAWADHLGVPVESVNPVGMTLRLIPPGEFTMGSGVAEIDWLITHGPDLKDAPDWIKSYVRAEGPERRATVREPYLLGAHEVTVGQFRRFVAATGYKTEAERTGGGVVWNIPASRWDREPANVWSNPAYASGESHPVVFVTPADAKAFCDWLGGQDGRTYTVPTEEQWEYACRAGTATRWAFGDDPAGMAEHGWTLPHSDSRPHPVGRKRANPFGLYDLHGNVTELAVTPQGKAYQRGGQSNETPHRARSAWRYPIDKSSDSTYRRGFRVAVVGDLRAASR